MKVSVIIPTYNYAKFIEEAINSVLCQSWQQFEIIVVDDGSTDHTADVLKKFTDSRIIVIKTLNSGVSSARNTGLDAASGDFIAFLDADDRWLPDMLDRQLALIETDSAIGCVFCNFIRFNDWNGEKLPDQFNYFPELDKIPTTQTSLGFGRIILRDPFSYLVDMYDIPAFTPAMLFRKSTIGELRFSTNLVCCEDTHFVLKVFLRGKVAFNDEVLAEIRRHKDNATKDLEIFPVAKLTALKALSMDVTFHSDIQKCALDVRLLKAYAMYSYSLLTRKKRLDAWKNHFESFSVRNNYCKKLLVTVKLIFETILSYLIRANVRHDKCISI